MPTLLTTVGATLREPAWWAWLVTGGLLLAGVLGSRPALGAAILFALAQYAYFAAADDSRLPLAAQVRLAVALFLTAADAAGLLWLCWVAVAGTAVRLGFGYDLIGRMLSLLPWNRIEALSRDLVRRTFLTPPSPFLSESKISAVMPASGRRHDGADAASMAPRAMPLAVPARRTETRIDRGVREATQRRASIANSWRKRNSRGHSGLTDRQDLDCAS